MNSGEQALLNNMESIMKIIDTNMDEAVAWKDGLFQFDGGLILLPPCGRLAGGRMWKLSMRKAPVRQLKEK